jgi:hypothetical protein
MSGEYLRASLTRAHRPACKTVVVTQRGRPAPLSVGAKIGAASPLSQPLLGRGLVDHPTVAPTEERQRSVTPTRTAPAVPSGVTPEAIEPTRTTPTLPTDPQVKTKPPLRVAAPRAAATTPSLRTSFDEEAAQLAHSGSLRSHQRTSSGSPPESEKLKQGVAIPSADIVSEEIIAEPAADPRPLATSAPASAERKNRANSPEFRVSWPAANRSLPAPAHAQVEKEVIRAAQAEFYKRTNSSGTPGESPAVVNVRVENVTVKIEPLAPAWTPPRPISAVNAEGAFASHFLKRSISGF